MTTKSQAASNDISALLRARNALLWITTTEEARVERYLAEACRAAGYIPVFWDCAAGVTSLDGRPAQNSSPDLTDTLNAIATQARQGGERRVWVLRDLHKWLEGPVGVQTLRQLRNLARMLPGTPRESAQAIVVLTPASDVPAELTGHATVIAWPSPDREEIAEILDNLAKTYSLDLNGSRDAAIDAAIGLSGDEAASFYAKSLVVNKRIDPAAVAQEKKRVISKSGVLEWLDGLPGGLDSVGGLDGVKTWVSKRAVAFTAAARAYGLPAPKGILLAGISGCGKSLTPKALATEWRCPLVRFDFGALKGKFVGQSEGNLRKAINTIDSLGPCIVLVDEIEKALAGATQGAADGGVSADALGTFLGWMNDRTSQAFVVATANDITSIVNNAPELLRKGRFDELFFVDLPNTSERIEVLQATLNSHKRGDNDVDFERVADATDRFTGAEIASIVPEAMFAAFADGARELTTADLIEAARTVVPLSETAKDKITAMRAWATGKARPATTPQARTTAAPTARVLDL